MGEGRLDEVEDALLLITYEGSHGHVAVPLEDVDFDPSTVRAAAGFLGRCSS